MKKYKTSEAIAMLEQNPKLRFRAENVEVTRTMFLSMDENGYLDFKQHEGPNRISGNLKITAEWELIQQPVPFLEAVKAYSEGKTIRCECEGMKARIYNPGIIVQFLPLEDNYGQCVSTAEILTGIWYVED